VICDDVLTAGAMMVLPTLVDPQDVQVTIPAATSLSNASPDWNQLSN